MLNCVVNNTCTLEGALLTVKLDATARNPLPCLGAQDEAQLKQWAAATAGGTGNGGAGGALEFLALPRTRSATDVEEGRALLARCAARAAVCARRALPGAPLERRSAQRRAERDAVSVRGGNCCRRCAHALAGWAWGTSRWWPRSRTWRAWWRTTQSCGRPTPCSSAAGRWAPALSQRRCATDVAYPLCCFSHLAPARDASVATARIALLFHACVSACARREGASLTWASH